MFKQGFAGLQKGVQGLWGLHRVSSNEADLPFRKPCLFFGARFPVS